MLVGNLIDAGKDNVQHIFKRHLRGEGSDLGMLDFVIRHTDTKRTELRQLTLTSGGNCNNRNPLLSEVAGCF
ncbi:hypothetical protein D3C80_2067960 [compost metagenome]